jgi:uncharacterized membrane protein YhaH (DUF805 family)
MTSTNLPPRTMNFSESIATCMSKYATFSGRASRAEFWWFYLFSVLLGWGATLVGVALFGDGSVAINLVVWLVLFLPSSAVYVRRLHDTGRSGWNIWWILTIIGFIPLIIWLASQGDAHDNRYGPPQ